MSLKDLVVYLGNRHAAGLLNLELEGIRKTVTLHDGAVINAGSNRPREYLGQFLINMGQLTEDQFARAYEEQQRTRVLLGKILVQQGLVTEAAILNALNLKFRETLLSAFSWTAGTFSFAPAESPSAFEGVETRVELLDIVKEGEFRDTAWQAIRAVFPHGHVRLSLKRQNLAEPPRPGSLDERLFALIEEGATIDEMVLALHATDFFLYQRLYALYRLDALGVHGAPAPPPSVPPVVGDESTLEEILRHAQAFLDQGNLEDALMLGRRAQELNRSAEASAFVRRVETALLAALQRDLSQGERVPALKIAPAQVKTVTLAAPERYLLSRVDGQRTVRAIVQVAPLQELEALRAFKSFLDKGWVGFR